MRKNENRGSILCLTGSPNFLVIAKKVKIIHVPYLSSVVFSQNWENLAYFEGLYSTHNISIIGKEFKSGDNKTKPTNTQKL